MAEEQGKSKQFIDSASGALNNFALNVSKTMEFILDFRRNKRQPKERENNLEKHRKNCRYRWPQFKVNVHNSTIRKTLAKAGIHGRVPRRKPLLSKKNMKSVIPPRVTLKWRMHVVAGAYPG
ncbi:uncharacterized protein LOC144091178 [Stigmatopora argus]